MSAVAVKRSFDADLGSPSPIQGKRCRIMTPPDASYVAPIPFRFPGQEPASPRAPGLPIAWTFHLNFVLVSPFLARESAHIEAKPACSEFFEGQPHAIVLFLI